MKTLDMIIAEYNSELPDPCRNFRQEHLKERVEKELGTLLEADVLFIRGEGGYQSSKFKTALSDGKPRYFAGDFFNNSKHRDTAYNAGYVSLEDRLTTGDKIAPHMATPNPFAAKPAKTPTPFPTLSNPAPTPNPADTQVVSNICIYQTTDYDLFTPMKGQPVDRARKNAKDLAEKLDETKGNIIPILVTHEKVIIDGNTRLEACRLRGYPVRYQEISTEKDREIMKMMNTSSRPWSQDNFIEFYAEAYNNENYIALREFLARNKYGVGVYAPLEPKLTAAAIKSGEVQAIDYEELQRKTDLLTRLCMAGGPFMPSKLHISRAVATILSYTKDTPEFSFEDLIALTQKNISSEMKKRKMNQIKHQFRLQEILQSCYNRNKAQQNRIRLYNDL